MEQEIELTLPAWMIEKIANIASISGKTVEQIVAIFFVSEVVHT